MTYVPERHPNKQRCLRGELGCIIYARTPIVKQTLVKSFSKPTCPSVRSIEFLHRKPCLPDKMVDRIDESIPVWGAIGNTIKLVVTENEGAYIVKKAIVKAHFTHSMEGQAIV